MIVQGLECPVLVAHVSIPSIGVERILNRTKPGSDVYATEHDLRADKSPCGASAEGVDKFVVEPDAT